MLSMSSIGKIGAMVAKQAFVKTAILHKEYIFCIDWLVGGDTSRFDTVVTGNIRHKV